MSESVKILVTEVAENVQTTADSTREIVTVKVYTSPQQVQSDWNQATTTAADYIKNKPSAFTPSAHKSSHATGGSDALAPSDIGAVATNDSRLSDARTPTDTGLAATTHAATAKVHLADTDELPAVNTIATPPVGVPATIVVSGGTGGDAVMNGTYSYGGITTVESIVRPWYVTTNGAATPSNMLAGGGLIVYLDGYGWTMTDSTSGAFAASAMGMSVNPVSETWYGSSGSLSLAGSGTPPAVNSLTKVVWSSIKATIKYASDRLYVPLSRMINGKLLSSNITLTASDVGAVATTDTRLDLAATTHAATSKTTPVDADELPLVDSQESNGIKKLTWANLKATLKSYFDGFYAMLSGYQTLSLTAVKGGRYHIKGSAAADGSVAITDPSSPAPAAGDIFKCVIVSGYVRIGGVDYFKSRHEITRHYTGSAWETLAPYYSEAPDYAAGIKSTAREKLGAGAVGDAVFTASTTAAAQTAIDLRKSRAKAVVIENEFISGSTGITGLYAFAVSSGTVAANTGTVTANHPGVITLRDSTTANGGYYVGTETNTMLLAGGESCEFVFQVGSARSTQTVRLGFQDSNGSTAPTDGVWLEIVGNGTAVVCTGKTSSNSSSSSTGTTYTMATGTWFSAVVTVVSSSSVTFAIYNEAGSLVWSDTLSTNIPTAAARLTGFGVVATESTTDAAADMLYLDYLNLKIDRALTR